MDELERLRAGIPRPEQHRRADGEEPRGSRLRRTRDITHGVGDGRRHASGRKRVLGADSIREAEDAPEYEPKGQEPEEDPVGESAREDARGDPLVTLRRAKGNGNRDGIRTLDPPNDG